MPKLTITYSFYPFNSFQVQYDFEKMGLAALREISQWSRLHIMQLDFETENFEAKFKEWARSFYSVEDVQVSGFVAIVGGERIDPPLGVGQTLKKDFLVKSTDLFQTLFYFVKTHYTKSIRITAVEEDGIYYSQYDQSSQLLTVHQQVELDFKKAKIVLIQRAVQALQEFFRLQDRYKQFARVLNPFHDVEFI